MYINLVSINENYRGIDRNSMYAFDQAFEKCDRKVYKKAVDDYSEYLENEQLSIKIEKRFYDVLLPYYNILNSKGANCEIILYDSHEYQEFLGYKLEFLGIDVFVEFETLLRNCSRDAKQYLNTNMLCDNMLNAKKIVNIDFDRFYNTKDKCEYLYVYKIII